MSDWMIEYQLRQKKEGEEGRAFLFSLLPILEKAEVKLLVVHYDGSGDSGEIESVTAFSDEDRETEVEIALPKDKTEEAASNIMSGQGIDWYNNEGGYGDVVLDVVNRKIKIEHNYRIETSEYSEIELDGTPS